MGTIAGIDLGSLKEGQSWEDQLTVTVDRRLWHIALAAITQMGQQVCEGIEDMTAKAIKGDIIALLMAQALNESNDDLRELSLGIVQVVHPDLFAEVKRHAAEHADA